jgi:hypothetical protein
MAEKFGTKARDAEDVYTSNAKKANRDPITGEPGSHPIATGVGAAAGAATGVVAAAAMGAATGAAFGPAGAITGAIAGGILGGGVGHGIGEDIYPTQLAWWNENYVTRPYVKQGAGFDEYRPAYWYGIHAYQAFPQTGDFSSIEPQLGEEWDAVRGNSTLSWDEAQLATRDAYERLHRSK